MISKVGGVVKLIDFGLAKKLPDGEDTLRSALIFQFYLSLRNRFSTTVPGTMKYAYFFLILPLSSIGFPP